MFYLMVHIIVLSLLIAPWSIGVNSQNTQCPARRLTAILASKQGGPIKQIPIVTEEFTCVGKPNGLYPVPGLTCTKYFYYCSRETAYLYDCHVQDTVFNYAICNCDFIEFVPECQTTTISC